MNRWYGKVAIVTGASSGIGAAIAKELVIAGLQVVGLARRKEKVETLSKELEGKSGKLHAVYADMTKEEDIINAFEWAKNNVGPIHILVNNAGVSAVTNLMEGDTKLWKETLETNVLALCIATREAVKDMRKNNVDGHIIHMNSVVGHHVPNYAFYNVYPASKYAVTALTETLRKEFIFSGSRIKVTSISPGLVDTDIFETSHLSAGLPYKKPNSKAPYLKAEDIAQSVIYVLSTPPHVQVNELLLRAV